MWLVDAGSYSDGHHLGMEHGRPFVPLVGDIEKSPRHPDMVKARQNLRLPVVKGKSSSTAAAVGSSDSDRPSQLEADL